MKRFSRIITTITAILLVIGIFISAEPCQLVCAAEGQNLTLSKQYLSEVKMFYGTSESAARSACEKEGFTFCPTDLNEGAPNVIYPTGSSNFETRIHIHMGYKTTTDPGDAITDLTLLDMKNTHFEEIDYKKYLDEHVSDFRTQAECMMVLVNELDRQKEAGSPNANIAYDALNLFYVDEKKSHDAEDNLLGNYLLNNANIEFFEKFIQRGNSMVLSTVTNILCYAASDYNADGSTWVDRSKTSEVPADLEDLTSDVRNKYNSMYEDPAKRFIDLIQQFRTTYTEAKQRYDQYGDSLGYSELEGMTEENSAEILANAGSDCRFPEYSDALKTYALLDSIYHHRAGEKVETKAGLIAKSDTDSNEEAAQGDDGETADSESENATEAPTEPPQNTVVTYDSDMTLAQYIMDLASDSTLKDHPSTVYPIMSALTQAQRATLSLGGFGSLVEGLIQANDYATKRDQSITDAMNKLKGLGYSDGRIYIWEGVDKSLYNKKVVQTNAKREAAAADKDLEESLNKAEAAKNNKLQRALNIVDVVTMSIIGLVTIAELIIGSSFWTLGTSCFVAAGVSLAAGAVGSATLSTLVGAVFCAIQVINIVANVISFALLIVNMILYVLSLAPETIDYSSLPDVVLDARQSEKCTYSVRYDSVPSNASFQSLLNGDITLRDWQVEGKRNRSTSSQEKYNYTINYEDISDKHAELTAYQGQTDRWLAMYYSKSPAAGEPIEVTPGQEPFVTKGDYQPPEGYKPLSLVVGSTAVDVNDVSVFAQKSPPLYVFFPGEAAERATGGEVSGDGRYVTGVRFSYSENRQDAINLLKKEDYEYIDTNLTPYSGYTYLGYQLGSEKNALTDIRISNSGAKSIVFGSASYANMGMGSNDKQSGTTPDGFSLYATSSPAAGTPIVALSIKTKRLEQGSGMEPVCLFSGGDAVDVGAKWSDNLCTTGEDDDYKYFAGLYTWTHYSGKKSHEYMTQDDPSNGFYLYFQPKVQYKSTNADGKKAQRYIAGFSYFLAGDKDTTDNRFGSNYEYMQTFAKENGFELLTENGSPLRVMSDQAGEMTMVTTWRDVGGYPADTYNFDQIHTLHYDNKVLADTDGGLVHGAGFNHASEQLFVSLSRDNEKMIYHTAMYFGVAYTYNPYRAITGVSGLITSYTETSSQIKNTGLSTPAGTFLACNVSIQGCPMTSAGITAGYYNARTMFMPLYTNYEAREKSGLSWMTDKETEVLTRYLLTCGPRTGVLPLKEGDIAFVTSANPGKMDGYHPLCDLRTPGDYEHPMNFALDTTNKGSKYLYLYLCDNAGGREGAKEFTNKYSAKQYVAAVFCGAGKTPEEAIAKLYQQAADQWKTVAAEHADVNATPMITEFAEIIPVDLSSEYPWYELHANDTNIKSLKNGVFVRGNELAYYRWDGHGFVDDKTSDDYEKDLKCAYIGVVRTGKKKNAVYGMLKYYSDADTAPSTLNAGNTKCILAGGPVKSKEGAYYLYYSPNSGTASYTAPVTGLEISKEIFVNGYNTAFTVKESDRVDNKLPEYEQLRMRTDEHKYIHLGYDRAELPYYEMLYIGVGDTKEKAFVDMIGTTNAYAAIDVDCNYNSNANQWIAIGYRRTSKKSNAIRDVFLYLGDDPPDQVRIKGGYTATSSGSNMEFSTFTYKNEEGVPYYLVKHNLKDGKDEVVSLNKGNGGNNMYLYYTTKPFYREQSAEGEVTPITNMCFTYGDISPRYATTEQLASAFERSYYAKKKFNASAYEDPIWECVLGVTGSPQNWKLTAEGATRLSLNEGVRPGLNNNGWDGKDSRVYMYVDRADSKAKTKYKVRENAKLPEFGYYASESTFGYLKQVG